MLIVDVAKVNKKAARCACEWVVSIPERVATHVTRIALSVLHAMKHPDGKAREGFLNILGTRGPGRAGAGSRIMHRFYFLLSY